MMKDISITRSREDSRPMSTPAGKTEKYFRALIKNYQKTGCDLILEIEIRDSTEINGNRIVVTKLEISNSIAGALGVTGDLLRKIPVQKVADMCVMKSIEVFAPGSKTKKSLRVPSSNEVRRVELVALTKQSLGMNAPVKEVQIALQKQGTYLAEGTIRNYLTKATKAGLMNVQSVNEYEIPLEIAKLTPDDLGKQGAVIDKILEEVRVSGNPPLSPSEYRRRQEEAQKTPEQKEAEIREAKNQKRLINLEKKRQADIKKRNSPVKPKIRKEGK